jgi:hypothetical protein
VKPRLVVVACVVVVVQVLVAAGVLVARLADPAPSSPPAAVADRGDQIVSGQTGSGDQTGSGADVADRARAAALTSLLVGRANALLRRDRAAFLAGVDPGTPFHARQAALFDALARVPLGDVSYDFDAGRTMELPPAAAKRYRDPVWGGAVRLRYALTGYDAEPTTQEHYLTFVQRADRWYLASDDDFTAAGQRSARGLWDFGPVVAVRTPRVLVLGHPGSLGLMRQILAVADAAVPRVSQVWPDWSRKAVVLVPASAAELRQVVEHTGNLSRLAAVATADVSVDGGPPTGRRVAVNPAQFRSLSAFGRRVVIRHELTHVATRAVTSAHTPYWLAEGFADYVAYRGTDTTVAAAAEELRADVAAGRVPARLPRAADFTGDNPRLAQAYEMSWLACRLIADRIGAAGLVRLYRTVSESGDPEAALAQELEMTTAEFVAAWRADMRRELT